MPEKKLASLACTDISNSTQLEKKRAKKKKFCETHCFQMQPTDKASREGLLGYNVTIQLFRTSGSEKL